MRETLEFTIDTIEIVPDNSVCYIQAPDVNNVELLELLEESKYNWAKQIVLTLENKLKLKSLLLKVELEDRFHNVTIERESKKIFEGYDGMEIGEISKNLVTPNWYDKKYIETEYCNRANDW